MSELDILSFGETMAMFVAEQSGDLAQVGHFHKRIAGADSNVAIGLSRLGFKVGWLSRVGADSWGVSSSTACRPKVWTAVSSPPTRAIPPVSSSSPWKSTATTRGWNTSAAVRRPAT